MSLTNEEYQSRLLKAIHCALTLNQGPLNYVDEFYCVSVEPKDGHFLFTFRQNQDSCASSRFTVPLELAYTEVDSRALSDLEVELQMEETARFKYAEKRARRQAVLDRLSPEDRDALGL